MSCRWLTALLIWTMVCPVALGDNITVTLKAIDAAGQPVAKAEVALFWDAKDGAMTAGAKPIVTDAGGKAVLRVDTWNEKRPVLVLSSDRMLGGIVGVSNDDDGKEVTITVGPTIRVRGKLECKELKAKPDSAITTVTPDGFRPFFAQNHSRTASFEFVLPAGKYMFGSYGTDVEDAKQAVVLTGDRREHDLGTLDMKASPIARLRGKQVPDWSITDARGAKGDVKLADYKGKWVYLEFWGFW